MSPCQMTLCQAYFGLSFTLLHGLMASRYREGMAFTLIPRGMGLDF
jgi:hypothetical protein